MVSLSWRHQALIQALISRGPLKESDFQSIFSGVTGKNPGVSKRIFDRFLLEINKELSYVHFELRACRDQYDGQVCYGVVNNVSDEQSKLGTKYSVPQIAFFKGVMEAIAQDETASGSISSFDALNIRPENQISTEAGSSQQEVPAALRNFTMSQKEKTLGELVRDKWLCLTPEGNYGIGIRSLLDLRSWFRNNNIPCCEVCNEAGVKAEICSSRGCTIRVHKYCLKNMLPQGNNKVCPGCNKAWHVTVTKVEEAPEEADEENEISENQTAASQPKRRKLRSNRTFDTDLAGNCSSQASGASTSGVATRRVTRSTSHSGSQR
ncbi:PREDICTED: non-structural maintenance of chromosomes element 1 homolog [Tarenaya hassleriana]|uniref:non-structural maintenance of chromosomes element 1 homolog n=1 Tax=Tarenaya hassleriana TaxID=28532 RepID=UPI00053C8575|nr:PREDICTED: non-structural maintenance of chromosomes element 1 homolog [Tarenaya hassleriana]